jgi:hypothetical protein
MPSRSIDDHDISPRHTAVVRIHSRSYAIDRPRWMLAGRRGFPSWQIATVCQAVRGTEGKDNTRSILLSAGVRTRKTELIQEHTLHYMSSGNGDAR